MKPGRNDPCPCGSGKKYKHCCLAAAADCAESARELTWRRVRRALDDFEMGTRLLRFVSETYGPSAIQEAWAEFTVWPDDEVGFDPDSPHVPLFMSWLFHAWAPDPQETSVEDKSLHDRVPTQVFLERHGRRVDPWVCRYLEACVQSPLSFQEIVRVEPGQGFRTRDLFTGKEFDVMERSASQTLKVHDVVFGQLVRIDEIVMLESCSPFGLPPGDKIPILDLRDRILSAAGLAPMEALREYDIELRELYLSMSERFLEPRLPELQNTDGEPLVPQRVIFDIDSPRRAFDALKHLAADESEADLLAAAEQGPNGELLRADIPWTTSGNARHRSWKNTLLGRIRIESNRLTCEVNSVERAETIRQIMKESLGEEARYRATEIQSIERMMTEGATGASQSSSSTADQHAALTSHPEIRAHLDAVLAAHYQDWVTEKIPALGDQTPLEAVQSPGGRERVEALVLDIERSSAAMPTPPDPAIFRQLRERLGLMEPE